MASRSSHPLKRCPRCGGVTIRWTEVSEAYQTFDQDASGISRTGYTSHGPILNVNGECIGCGHAWRPRRANGRPFIMVTQLPGATHG